MDSPAIACANDSVQITSDQRFGEGAPAVLDHFKLLESPTSGRRRILCGIHSFINRLGTKPSFGIIERLDPLDRIMLDRESLNYHHLYYFWVVAREGGIARASDTLKVASSTISSQVSSLEKSLQTKLFHRSGRNLVLSEEGRTAFRFAEEIFSLGRDLAETLRSPKSHRPLRLAVGVADVVPKLVATKFLEPAVDLGVRLICKEGQPAKLLADMALHLLDVVLLDAPVGSESNIRAFSHRLSSSPLRILGSPEMAARYREGFPASLDGAPFLLPTHESFLRPVLDQWFDKHDIRPNVVGEFDDSALIKAFGERSAGLLATPELIWPQVEHQYGLEAVGILDSVQISFYAATLDRKVKHSAVTKMLEAAGK